MGTYNDFSQLKKFKPVEAEPVKPAKPAEPADRALANAADSEDYFSSLLGPRETPKKKKPTASAGVPVLRTTVVTPATVSRVREEQVEARIAAREAELAAEAAAREDELKAEIETQKAACAEMAAELVAANEQLANANSALAEAQAQIESDRTKENDTRTQLDAIRIDLAKSHAQLEAAHGQTDELRAQLTAAHGQTDELRAQLTAAETEIARLRAELATAQTALAAQFEKQPAGQTPAPSLPTTEPSTPSETALLDKPSELAEKFFGEIREHVVETLAEAYRAAEAGGRDRRARVLEAVLVTNPPTGELEQRRAEVKQIVKEAGSTLDNTALAALEKIGFRYISGNKHHKLDWAGIRFPIAKTPSDYRACLNSAAEINNRVF
ncbi:MAG: hypothetical protein MJ249_02445 [Kiritimatiellae bacterium]|nr:hypothetical protein [Kiritimatiellia bacterium]